jgi:hypothetical protein
VRGQAQGRIQDGGARLPALVGHMPLFNKGQGIHHALRASFKEGVEEPQDAAAPTTVPKIERPCYFAWDLSFVHPAKLIFEGAFSRRT